MRRRNLPEARHCESGALDVAGGQPDRKSVGSARAAVAFVKLVPGLPATQARSRARREEERQAKGMRSKSEERVTLHITKDLVERAIAQDPRACTLACAGQQAGLPLPSFTFDMTTGDVVAAWDEIEEATGRVRHHTAVAEPVKRAFQILVATDLDKKRLARLVPDEGWEVELANHESRYKQQTRPGGKAPQKRTGESVKRKPRRTSSRMMRISGTPG